MAANVRICFVCAGNICRSPTALGVMKKLVEDAGLAHAIELDSAGTGAWHVGELPDPRTRAAAARRGLDLATRARQLTRLDLDRFDLLVVMDADNLRHVQRMVGGRTRPEVHLLRSFDADAPPGAPVPDPYYEADHGFEHVLDICERACAGLLARVRTEL